ncbi:MAG: glycosyltransferase family 39 protein [Oligoflexia bacterium]|nr:glycosyltransferase family 39 protein [Oligoflexia bacterium]
MKLELIHYFIHYAGYITLLGLVMALFSVWITIKDKIDFNDSKIEILLSIVVTLIVFLSVQIDLKVLSDETNLISVANMLAYEGKASNTEQWVWYYHTFHALDVSTPTRPILYPLLIAIVHLIAGVSLKSAFIVNFICLFLLNFLTLRFVRKKASKDIYPHALFALVLIMNSALSIMATSAGFDLCSLLFGFSTFLLLGQYYVNRSSENLRALFFMAICFSSVRYESILILPIIAMFLLFEERFKIVKKLNIVDYALGLLFISPLITQRLVTWGSFENPDGVAPFSIGHIIHHTPIFFYEFFINGNGPYPIIAHLLGVVGVVVYVIKNKGIRSEGKAAAVFVCTILSLLLAHHFGFAGHPTQVRLFLPISFFLCVFSIYALSELKHWTHLPSVFLIFGLLAFHHHKYAVQDPLMSTLSMTREVRHLRDFIKRDGDIGDIYVYDRPGQLSAIGLSAISWNKFKQDQARYLTEMRNRLYQRMLVIERVKYGSSPEEFSLVREGYRLTPLYEQQLTPQERLRVSRVDW